jgi:hypothetical protein
MGSLPSGKELHAGVDTVGAPVPLKVTVDPAGTR